MGLYHPLDGITNLKHKLLYFLKSIKKNSKWKALAFNRDRCCHQAICLHLILFHLKKMIWLFGNLVYDNELTFVYRYILLWLLSLNPNFKRLRFINLDTLSNVLDKCLRFSLIKIESVSIFNNQATLGSIYPLLYILSY